MGAFFGVAHGLDLSYVFRLDLNADAEVPFGETERNLAEYFSVYWGQFAKTLNPNGGLVPVGPNLLAVPPAWPRYQPNRPFETVMRLADPPVTNSSGNDIEAEVERRCSWWASQTGSRSDKHWQMTNATLDLGSRCCCDFDHKSSNCKRIAAKKDARREKSNWRGHCPQMDLGHGIVQSHHSPIGCLSPRVDAHLKCCCVQSLFGQRLCHRMLNFQLASKSRCPKVCLPKGGLNSTLPFARCRRGIQSRQDRTGFGCL